MIKINKFNESYAHVVCDFDISTQIAESDYFRFRPKGYNWSQKYQAGIWDGYISLFNKKTGLIQQGLLPRLVRFLKENDLKYKVDPNFKVDGVDLSTEWIKEFCKDALQCNIVPRDYQIKAVQRILKKRKSINVLPTASGKSFIFYIAINILLFLDPDRKIVLIVPSTNLVEQMTSDFCEYAENWCDYNENVHKIYSGKEKYSDKPVIISTWQSLQNIKQLSYFKQFNTVLLDECHTASVNKKGQKKVGNVLSQIINKCDLADIRVALTGSLNDSFMDELQLIGLFGPVKKIAKTKELIDAGFLSKFKIRSCILNYDRDSRRLCKKFSFQQEAEWLRGSKRKLAFIKKLAKSREGNTLILFKIRSYGKAIEESLLDCGKKVYYIDGNTPVEEREQIRAEVEKRDNVIIVSSYAVFSTGINIKNLHNLVFAESTKSIIKIIQSIGRILRKHNSKEIAVLYDIVDNLKIATYKNYSLKHYIDRKKFYNNDEFQLVEKIFKL